MPAHAGPIHVGSSCSLPNLTFDEPSMLWVSPATLLLIVVRNAVKVRSVEPITPAHRELEFVVRTKAGRQALSDLESCSL
eukprot:2099638-Prymnesium_polylepis.1